jgi:hypothetical protein
MPQFAHAYSEPKIDYREEGMLKQRPATVGQNAFQQKPIVKTAYTSAALDSGMKQQFESVSSSGFETSTKMPQMMYQTQVINQVSSVTQHVDSDFNQPVTTAIRLCDSNAQCLREHSQIHCEVQKVNHNLQKPQASFQFTSKIPQMTDDVYKPHRYMGETPEKKVQFTNIPNTSTQSPQKNVHLSQENINEIRIKSDNKVTAIMEEQRNVKLRFPCSRNTEECKIKYVTDKPRIHTSADALKRPISPEFAMFPNSRSTSLLKLVLSKSLENYSPQDFEKMKASVTETYNESEDDEDSDIEKDEEDAEEEEEDDSSAEVPRSVPCDSSLSGNGSFIFESYCVEGEVEERCSDDSEPVQQYGMSFESLSSNVSASSSLSELASTPGDCTG